MPMLVAPSVSPTGSSVTLSHLSGVIVSLVKKIWPMEHSFIDVLNPGNILPYLQRVSQGVKNYGSQSICSETVTEVKSSKEEGAGSKEEGEGSKEEGTCSKEEGTCSKKEGEGSKKEGAGSKEEGEGSKKEGAGSKEEGEGSKEEGACSKEEGACSKEEAAHSAGKAECFKKEIEWNKVFRKARRYSTQMQNTTQQTTQNTSQSRWKSWLTERFNMKVLAFLFPTVTPEEPTLTPEKKLTKLVDEVASQFKPSLKLRQKVGSAKAQDYLDHCKKQLKKEGPLFTIQSQGRKELGYRSLRVCDFFRY